MKFFRKGAAGKGFTIVELIVIIGVIGILAGITVVGYGAWQKSIAESAVKADLTSLESAMKQYRNFNSGYATSIPPTFKAGDTVTVEYLSGTASSYCIRGTSTRDTSVIYYLEVDGTKTRIGKEPCVTGNWKALAVSNTQSCAISVDNALMCWGEDVSSPAEISKGEVPSGMEMTSISAGSSHFCVLAGGWAYCWGDNSSGKLGLGSRATGAQSSPMRVEQGAIPAGVTLTSVVGGGFHSCALGSNGAAYCWGSGVNGELGRGSTSSSTTPVAVNPTYPAGTTLKKIAAGGDNTCAIGSNNLAYCWGRGSAGANGNNAIAQMNSPAEVLRTNMPSGTTFADIAVGSAYACAIGSDGLAYCWGQGTYGQLGGGGSTSRPTPYPVTPAVAGLTTLSIGYRTTCAYSSTQSYCWGENGSGQTGTGPSTPINVLSATATVNGERPSAYPFTSIQVGNVHSCGLVATGDIYCWGDGTRGQLGNDAFNSQASPTKISDPQTN